MDLKPARSMRPIASMRGIAVAVCSLALALSLACGEPETVVIATDGDYHPFNFINDDGEIDGMEREMGEDLCRRADLRCEWVLHDWDKLIPHLRARDFDAIMSGMSVTGEREQTIDFTQPYYPPTPSVYLALAGAGDEAVEGALGAHAPTIHSDFLLDRGIYFTIFREGDDSLGVLRAGGVDAILVDHAYAIDRLKEHPDEFVIVGPSVDLDRGIGIGLREDSHLKAKFNEALTAMKEDGTLNALLLKWFGEAVPTF